MKKMNNKGFSLVELIVVIAIMAVLVGVLAPQFIKYVENSRRSTDISSAESIRSAVLADIADQIQYTATTTTTVEITGTTGSGLPSSISEEPKVKATAFKDCKFKAEYNAVSGTCNVYVSGYNLTDPKQAANYKNQLAPDAN